MALERELKVAVGWSKEREREQLGIKLSLEEERRGEREEKKNLKEKRVEDEKGGKERRILAVEVIAVRYGDGFWRWWSGLRSTRRTIRWVLE